MRANSKTARIRIGDRFGRLVVEQLPRYEQIGKYRVLVCHCRCDCGSVLDVRTGNLITGNTHSCGCHNLDAIVKRNTTHGQSRTRLYEIWGGMIKRCEDENCRSFRTYGARGIAVCDSWRHNFIAFRDWALANGYREDLTIERKDNDAGYSPENCEWIPHGQQTNNRTISRWITAFGETRTLADWSRDPRCFVSQIMIARRIKEGMTPEIAITKPSRTKRKFGPRRTS
jgi:hypothetical protein